MYIIANMKPTPGQIKQRLKLVRAQMKRFGVDAYLVTGTDPHHNEYVAPCWKRREWLSGFTGSKGDMVVLQRDAGLWTDGRYHVQAAQELKGTSIKLFRMGKRNVPALSTWLSNTLSREAVLGVDPQVITRAVGDSLQRAVARCGARLMSLLPNLVDLVWSDRPERPGSAIQIHLQRYAGETVGSKLRRVREQMRMYRADVHLVTRLDEIAWLFNIRSSDIPFNPVAVAYAALTHQQTILFCDPDRFDKVTRRHVEKYAEIRPYDTFSDALEKLALERRNPPGIWVDPQHTNLWVLSKLNGSRVLNQRSPIEPMKARKNKTEIEGARRAHRRDGQALARFLLWLQRNVPRGGVTEISASEQLQRYRQESPFYRGESFSPISAYGPHGAIVHYSATPQTDAVLKPNGLYLIDSGAQYCDGTTDVTRTLLLGGRPTRAQKEHFTRVLKGHIALASIRFPVGTTGRQLDALARQYLWHVGLDYAHGTGHGVGSYLNVHEGPQSISARDAGAPLEPGNIISNEPGYYLQGEYGIRTENLLLVVHDNMASAPFLCFEVLTLCPIDMRLVDETLLDAQDKQWLAAYHARIRQELA